MNTVGTVTFGRPFSTIQQRKIFGIDNYPIMIAPYWALTDLEKRGDVFFRSTSDSDTLYQVKDMINKGNDEDDINDEDEDEDEEDEEEEESEEEESDTDGFTIPD